MDYFRQAIAADPNYALAYRGLADNYTIQDDVFAPARDTEPKAKAAALKALELDDRLAEAHEALGAVLFWYEYDWPGAEKELRRAIELNENLAVTHTLYGWYLICLGQAEKGIAEGVKAAALDPLAAEPLHVLSQSLYFARRYPEAVAVARKALDLDPQYFLAHLQLALIYMRRANRVMPLRRRGGQERTSRWPTGPRRCWEWLMPPMDSARRLKKCLRR